MSNISNIEFIVEVIKANANNGEFVLQTIDSKLVKIPIEWLEKLGYKDIKLGDHIKITASLESRLVTERKPIQKSIVSENPLSRIK